MMQRLAAVGIDMTAVGRSLEENGIASFEKAYQDVLARLSEMAAAQRRTARHRRKADR